jgi:L-alanine-DL-glutamate epimerase-like enolase superfamily enzyme
MRIVEMQAFVVQLPLRQKILHASASRTDSQNILIRCRLQDGTIGWGEGVPRIYVTGETAEGAMLTLDRTPLAEKLSKMCYDWPDVIAMSRGILFHSDSPDPRGHRSNSLQCAIELSILDAFGRCFGEPVSNVVNHFAISPTLLQKQESVRYSTTITASDAAKERWSAIKMRLYGFRHCKVKVGVREANDQERVGRIRFWLGHGMDIRLDANEAWPVDQVEKKLKPLLPFRISCLEQPSPHAELESIPEYKSEWPVPIMLDESLTSLYDAELAVRLGACDFFNIRLSKCGGILNSLRIAEFASQNNIRIQLGCHPGETGVLSAAGRHWATAIQGIQYLEGSYDRHLLRELPTYEDITFGYGGVAPALEKPGLGVAINPSVLDRIKMDERKWIWG